MISTFSHATKLILIILVLSLASCKSNTKYLKIGMAPNNAPMVIQQGNNLSGIEADFAFKLAKELRRTPKIIPLKRQDLTASLLRGEIDIIMSGISIKELMPQGIIPCNPHSALRHILFIRKREINKFRKRGSGNYIPPSMTVGILKGSYSETLIQRYMPKYKSVYYAETSNALDELQRGKIDCFLSNSSEAWKLANRANPTVGTISLEFSQEKISWLVSKNDLKFRTKINNVLNKWRLDGTLAKVINKWTLFQRVYR
jgi:ABC-type amino acid transport substrate-binding protein